MTRRRNFKRLVRARMRKTGESYTAARARMLGHAGPPPSHGGVSMHPFERLSSHARQALDLARWHALDEGDDIAVERVSGEEARLQGEVHRALSAWHASLGGGQRGDEGEGGARRGAAAPH